MKTLYALAGAIGILLACGMASAHPDGEHHHEGNHHKKHKKEGEYQSTVVKKEQSEKLLVGPDLNKVDIYIPNDHGKGEMSAGIEYLKVDSRVPAHIHTEMEEIIFIVKGEGLALVDGEETPVTAGDMILVTPSTAHGLTNTGETELEFFVVYSENDMMEFFRDYSFEDIYDVRERFSPQFMMELFRKHRKAFAVPDDVDPLFPPQGEPQK